MRHVPSGWLSLNLETGDRSGQIYRGLRERILRGDLRGGVPLPSSRGLAAALGVARSTVVVAYERLRAEGYTAGKPGGPTRVALLPARVLRASPAAPGALPAGAAPAGAFAPGVPDLSAFPRVLWARCLAARGRNLRVDDLGYEASAGLPALRQAILTHVSTHRGVMAEPDRVMILPSVSTALGLLARHLIRPGRTAAWIEEPGYDVAREVFRAAGATLVAVPVDSQGANVARVGGGPPAFIYVTPSHQYPTGVTMTLPRRLSLIETARRVGAVILEDDYDSDFLPGPPVAALQSIDGTEAVAYLGTFSKVLAPGLRTAYAILPRALVEPIAAAQRLLGAVVPTHVQAALADFLNDGHLRAHVRRMRTVYRDNGQRLATALERRCHPFLSVGQTGGGLQLAAWFRSRTVDDRAVSAALSARGFGPRPLSEYAIDAARPGLLFGLAKVEPEKLEAMIQQLEKLVAARPASEREAEA